MLNRSNFSLTARACIDVLPHAHPAAALTLAALGIILIVAGLICFGLVPPGLFPFVTTLLVVGSITCVYSICLLIKNQIVASKIKLESLRTPICCASKRLAALKIRLDSFIKKYKVDEMSMEALSNRIIGFEKKIDCFKKKLSFSLILSDDMPLWHENVISLEKTIEEFSQSSNASIDALERVFDLVGGPRGLEILMDSELRRVVGNTRYVVERILDILSKTSLKKFKDIIFDINSGINQQIEGIKELQRSLTHGSLSVVLPHIYREEPLHNDAFVFDSDEYEEEVIYDLIVKSERIFTVLDDRLKFIKNIYDRWRAKGYEEALDIFADQEIEWVDIVAELEGGSQFIRCTDSIRQIDELCEGLMSFRMFQEEESFKTVADFLPSLGEKFKALQDAVSYINSPSIQSWENKLQDKRAHLLSEVEDHLRACGYDLDNMTSVEINERACLVQELRIKALISAEENLLFLRTIAPLIDPIECDENEEAEFRVERVLSEGIRDVKNQKKELRARINALKDMRNRRILAEKNFKETELLLGDYQIFYQKMLVLLQESRRFKESGQMERLRTTEQCIMANQHFMLRMGEPYSNLVNIMLSKGYLESDECRQHQIYFAYLSDFLKFLKIKNNSHFLRKFFCKKFDLSLFPADARYLLDLVEKLKFHFQAIGCPKAAPFDKDSFMRSHFLLNSLFNISKLCRLIDSSETTDSETLTLGNRYFSIIRELDLV